MSSNMPLKLIKNKNNVENKVIKHIKIQQSKTNNNGKKKCSVKEIKDFTKNGKTFRMIRDNNNVKLYKKCGKSWKKIN